MWVRAFRGTHVTPPVLRAMELWDIGVLMDGDTDGPAPAFVMPRGEPQAPGDRPAPRMEAD